MSHNIDPEFAKLPTSKLAQVALSHARKLGASYAEFRCMASHNESIVLKNLAVERVLNGSASGYSIRLIYKGSWGFAATNHSTEASLRAAVEQALTFAKDTAVLNKEPVKLADEPAYVDTYTSAYKLNPFEVPLREKIERLQQLSQAALQDKFITFTDFDLKLVQENTYFANTTGSEITQQRIRTHGALTATHYDSKAGAFENMRTLAPPVGQGWEYYLPGGYEFDKEIGELPELVKEKLGSPSIKAGSYDLVIHPSNLWLTIHESIGHATEYDRALGYEANYAGTSFATPEKCGNLKYGSKYLNVTGDRVTPHGLSTVGYDDEGVKAQQWDIVKDGTLVDYQLNRQMAHQRDMRSNGCAYADSFSHIPLQRMPNVSLQPNPESCSTGDLIKDVEDGLYVLGDKSWSIDMQRYNFQFTGQRFYRIKNGKLAGQVNDAAYQGNTLEFWNSMDGTGDKSTYILGGAFNCGKGQPGQVAPVSHGCPTARFRGINVLNTKQEAKNA